MYFSNTWCKKSNMNRCFALVHFLSTRQNLNQIWAFGIGISQEYLVPILSGNNVLGTMLEKLCRHSFALFWPPPLAWYLNGSRSGFFWSVIMNDILILHRLGFWVMFSCWKCYCDYDNHTLTRWTSPLHSKIYLQEMNKIYTANIYISSTSLLRL